MKVRVAVTGGIGSGKSTVMKILAATGCTCFSCDEIYKEIILTADYVKAVAKAFPDCEENGIVLRGKLAQRVFENQKELEKLNALAHPLIMRRLEEKIEHSSASYVFVEVPLLFEGNFLNLFDKAVVVLRGRAQRIAAVEARDGLSKAEILSRMEKQFDYDTALKNGAFHSEKFYVLYNDFDEATLAVAVKKLLDKIKK